MILADGCEKENNEISVYNKYYIIHAFMFCVLLYLSEKWLYTAERRDKKTWGIWNAILMTSPSSNLARQIKKHRDSPKNPTQKLIDADDYETYAWSVWTYMPNGKQPPH